MTLGFPRIPGFGWLEDFLLGHWPEGDEDAMRRAAKHWSDMAEKLKELQHPADQSMKAALGAIEGQIHDSMERYWLDLGGDAGELQKLIDICDGFAKQLEEGATDIEYTKYSIYISAFLLVATLAWSWIPGEGQIMGTTAVITFKAAVKKLVQKLLDKLFKKGMEALTKRLEKQVGKEMAEKIAKNWATKLAVGTAKSTATMTAMSVGTDAAVQGLQIAEGNRHGWDLGKTAQAAESAAISGVTAGLGGAGMNKVASTAITRMFGEDVAQHGATQFIQHQLTTPATNLLGNSAATAAMQAQANQKIDLSQVWEGSGGGLGNKPEAHPGASTPTETTPASDTPRTEKPDTPATQTQAPPAATQPPSTEAPTAPSSTHPDAETTPASTATADPQAATSPASTTPGGHDTPGAPQPDSPTAGPSSAPRTPTGDPQPAPATGALAATPIPAGQAPAAAPSTVAPAPDRPVTQTPTASPTPAPTGSPATPITPRPSADISPRPDAPSRPESPSAATDTTTPPSRATDPAVAPAGAPDRTPTTSAHDTVAPTRPDTPQEHTPTTATDPRTNSPGPVVGKPAHVPDSRAATGEPPRKATDPGVSARNPEARPDGPTGRPERPNRTAPPARDTPPGNSRTPENTPTTGDPDRQPAAEKPNSTDTHHVSDRPHAEAPEPSRGPAPGADRPTPADPKVHERPSEPTHPGDNHSPTPAEPAAHPETAVRPEHETPQPSRGPDTAHTDPGAPSADHAESGDHAPVDDLDKPNPEPHTDIPLDVEFDNHLPNGEGIVYRPDRTAIGSDINTHNVRENVRNEGEHDVVVHGNRDGAPTPGNREPVHPDEIVQAILDNPNYEPGTPVRLLSCHSGNDVGWAQHVADRLGVPVRAPSDYVGVRQVPDSTAVIDNGGGWNTYHPNAERPQPGHSNPRSEPSQRPDPDTHAPNGRRSADGAPPGRDFMGGDRQQEHPAPEEHAPDDPHSQERETPPGRGEQETDRPLNASREPDPHDARIPDPAGDRDRSPAPDHATDDRQLPHRTEPVGDRNAVSEEHRPAPEHPVVSEPVHTSEPPRGKEPVSSLDLPEVGKPSSPDLTPAEPVHTSEPPRGKEPVSSLDLPEVGKPSSPDLTPAEPEHAATAQHSEPQAGGHSEADRPPNSEHAYSPQKEGDRPKPSWFEYDRRESTYDPNYRYEPPKKTGGGGMVSRDPIRAYAEDHGLPHDEVARRIETGELAMSRFGDISVPQPPERVESPEKITAPYLTEVVEHSVAGERREYSSMDPDEFPPGGELPSHMTRSMPEHALDDSAQKVDPNKICVTEPGDGKPVVWRDRSAGDEYLDPKHALFRMDSRGPEIFDSDFKSRDPRQLSVGAHQGDTSDGKPDGHVSLSTSAERTVLRDQRGLDSGDLEWLAAKGELTRLDDGNFRQTRYLHELYSPHGIDVDATFRDGSAHTNDNGWSLGEGEILAPGGISGDSIYQIWPREITLDPHGNVVSVHVGEPIVNPRFAHLDNPRFAASHDLPTPEGHQPDTDPVAPQNSPSNTPAPESASPQPARLDPPSATGLGRPADDGPRPAEPPQASVLYPSDPPKPQNLPSPDPEQPVPQAPESVAPQAGTPTPSQQAPEPQSPVTAPPNEHGAPEQRPVDESPASSAHPREAEPSWLTRMNSEHGSDQGSDPEPSSSSARPDASVGPERGGRPGDTPQPNGSPRPTDPHPSVPTQSRPMSTPESAPEAPHGRQSSPPEETVAPQPDSQVRARGSEPSPAAPQRPVIPARDPVPTPMSEHPQASEHPAATGDTPMPPRQPDVVDPSPAQPDSRPSNTDLRERDPAESPQQGSGPHPDDPGPNQGPRSPQPTVEPARELTPQVKAARETRESLRQQRPEDDRVTPVPAGRAPDGRPAYEFQRYPDQPGGPIAVAKMKVHVTQDGTMSPERQMKAWRNAQLAADVEFNHAQRLPWGDRLIVDLVYSQDPADANLHIHISENSPGPWHPDRHPAEIGRQLREQLGLPPDNGHNGPGLSPQDIQRLSTDITRAHTPPTRTEAPARPATGPAEINWMGSRADEEPHGDPTAPTHEPGPGASESRLPGPGVRGDDVIPGQESEQPHGEPGDQGRDGAPESAPVHDGTDVRPGDTDRPTGSGHPDPSARDLDDHSEHSELPTDRVDGNENHIVDELEAQPGRDLPGPGDVRAPGDDRPEPTRQVEEPTSRRSNGETVATTDLGSPADHSEPSDSPHSQPIVGSRDPAAERPAGSGSRDWMGDRSDHGPQDDPSDPNHEIRPGASDQRIPESEERPTDSGRSGGAESLVVGDPGAEPARDLAEPGDTRAPGEPPIAADTGNPAPSNISEEPAPVHDPLTEPVPVSVSMVGEPGSPALDR